MTRMDTEDNNQSGAGDDELSKLRAERDELYQRLARSTADFKNSQKRLEQEKEQSLQFANSRLVTTLLPVIDNFERALAVDATKTDAAAVLKGMQIVLDQFATLLKQQNVEVISPAPGEVFDPTKHTAVMQQENDQYPDHSVVQMLQKGYTMHGRTLRPASVIVSISKTKDEK
jgi:molecular chaperone GrpE